MVFGKKFNKEELQETVYDEIFGDRIERTQPHEKGNDVGFD
jgi:hypothetical protein